MKRYAVVDIGTNSARLMIADVRDHDVQTVMKTLRMIRMGEGMTEHGKIANAAMERAKEALLTFLEIAEEYKAEEFYCFATSAVRDAKNKDELVKYIEDCCGITIEIISGDQEATLGFAGSVQGRGGMFDIGGGSTEVMTGTKDDVRFQHSFNIGTVRSLQMFPGGDNASQDAYEGAAQLAERTFRCIPKAEGFNYVGIGGTATALAAIDLGLEEYDADAVQGHVLSIERMTEICAMLKSKTKQERQRIIGLEEKRADVIVFGAIIMLAFMNASGSEKVVISDRDNQEGYLMIKLGLYR